MERVEDKRLHHLVDRSGIPNDEQAPDRSPLPSLHRQFRRNPQDPFNHLYLNRCGEEIGIPHEEVLEFLSHIDNEQSVELIAVRYPTDAAEPVAMLEKSAREPDQHRAF